MLRIWTTAKAEGTWLQLQGSLSGPWVNELRRTLNEALSRSKVVTLDLDGLLYVAPDGIAFLRSLPPNKVVSVNCSAFVQEQLSA